jgi:predicted GIY-YIG superfamily endonuclease
MSKNIILATIYKLVFKHNTNIAYVGQSTNINSRFKQHIKNANDFSNIDNKLYFFMVFIIFILTINIISLNI